MVSFLELLVLICCAITFFVVAFRVYFWRLRNSQATGSRKKRIAFFHPYCLAGGGGERVLWKAVQALDDLCDEGFSIEVIVYTVDKECANYNDIVFEHVLSRFSIQKPSSLPISFVHLDKYANFLEKAARFSLFAESWGTMKFAFMALTSCTPDIFFDTTGCAFTFLVARLLAGCDVVAYVHYPTISTDMLRLVWERRPTYNNDAQVTRSILVTYVKTVYYIFFAIAYACTGSLCRVVMVNSTWTYGHISYLWRGASGRIWIVFPPCDTESLKSLSLERSHPEIVSIGQFRPEKDHQLQLRAFATLLNRYPRWKGTARLILIGSCRGPGDEQRVKELKQLGASLGVSDSVEFVLNQPYSVVKQWFERASVGIHTMWNEHFGIGIVEMMAAGLLVVAHNSGGPKEDIVVPVGGKSTGFLAVTEEQFAEAINAALSMDKASAKRTRLVARGHAARFSDDAFDASFKKVVIDSRLLCT